MDDGKEILMADQNNNGKSPLAEALRAQIVELASKGDSKDGTLTPEVLAKIMRIAKTGRDLLVSLNVSPANLAAMMKPRQQGFTAFPVMGENPDSLSDEQTSSSIMPYAMSSPGENFGMTAIREIIAAIKSANGSESPLRLVEALAAAREAGLQDVAKELEKKLGIGKEEPKLAAVVAKGGQS